MEYLLRAPSSLSKTIPIPPAPKIIPLLLPLNGMAASVILLEIVAAPNARKPLPSQGINVSEAALSPATTIILSARPT